MCLGMYIYIEDNIYPEGMLTRINVHKGLSDKKYPKFRVRYLREIPAIPRKYS
jgi:hypothetical protein